MSIPKNPILSCSHGFLAHTDVKAPSPTSQHNQSVNVLVYPKVTDNPYKSVDSTTTKTYADTDTDVMAHYGPTDEKQPPDNVETPNGVRGLKADGETELKSRSVETSENTLASLKKLNDDKDKLIDALVQLLDIYENNPLVVNKFVIADDVVLSNLVQALTNADEVTIYKDEYEPTCFKKKVSFSVIQKIIIKIGNEVYNLKYNFPDVVEFLERHHVSIKFVY